MRPLLQAVAAFDTLLSGFSRQGHRNYSICRQCHERLQLRARRTSHAPRRVAFSSLSAKRNNAAEATDQLETPDDYLPAETGESLEWIGSKEWLEARDAKPIRHKPFLPVKKLTKPQDIFRALHRSLVEIYARASSTQGSQKHLWRDTAPNAPDETQLVRFKVEPSSGKVVLVFPDREAKARLCDALGAQMSGASWTIEESSRETQEGHWASLTLGDVATKFAIIKRSMQLTGIRISDATINSCSTPQSLLAALTTTPKDIKVVDSLAEDRRLKGLDNVTIYGQRLTAMDKDQQLGRWKVIEQELERRGLPIFGS
ncbi:hypothetical protein NA57DRAFT_76691 [Rhizodiscina lignyota]|uniref:Large ribosomal subunit protein mL50 n=1 Tax=Rhizodiscina lignyota TaxID=1504668 RepID=A0A9P4IGQ6_9PEZI|nr:hypothetical protein NA57DRAFT_76691 [Rhizodiscina lignyota]